MQSNNKNNSYEKITALRSLMKAADIEAVIIPHSDEYQGEYSAAYAKRLEWLTGFSGSSGYGIIFQNKAWLFTDGRYHIQIRQQTDNNIYDYLDSVSMPLHRWIAQQKQGFALSYDPWLHSRHEITMLEQSMEQIGGSLKALDSNLIDQIWQDQPAPPKEAAYIHPLTFAGEKAQEKISKLKQDLAAQNIDIFICPDPTIIAWLLNIRGNDIDHIPISLARAIFFSSSAQQDQARKTAAQQYLFKDSLFIDKEKISPELHAYLSEFITIREESEITPILEQLARSHSGSFAIDPYKTPQKLYQIISAAKAEIRYINDPLALARAIKNPIEIKGAIKAQKRDSIAMIRFLYWLDQQPAGSICEITASDKLAELRQEAGQSDNMALCDLSFASVSGAGPNSAIIHYRATAQTNRQLQEGELYLIDSGGQYQDGTTDITRTIVIGKPSFEHKYYYSLVLKAMLQLSLARFPSAANSMQLDAIARHIMWQGGVDYAHGTGHGVGSYLSVHEGPQSISPRAQCQLYPGMIVSNEPGYYEENNFGIRLENLLLVIPATDSEPPHELPPISKTSLNSMLAFQTLTFCPFDRRLIIKTMFDSESLNFLNRYHAQIYRDYHKFLTSNEQNWLYQMTREI